jgi:hypothetical protein
MKFLKESLLSFFVLGVVFGLYFLAAGAVLFGLGGFASHGNRAATIHHLKSQT